MHINFNFCTTSKYFWCDTIFFYLIQHVFIYNINLFCQHVFLFYATLNIFSQHESLFLVSHNIFFVVTAYVLVTHIILVGNVTSVWNIFICWHNIFCATHLFVQHVQNVSLKDIVNKEKQICSHDLSTLTSASAL